MGTAFQYYPFSGEWHLELDFALGDYQVALKPCVLLDNSSQTGNVGAPLMEADTPPREGFVWLARSRSGQQDKAPI